MAAVRVGNADDSNLSDSRVLIDRLLDIAREHVKATGQDHVLLAVYQSDEAVLVEEADIAGVEPTPTEGFFSRLWLLPVTLDYLWPTKADFAFLSNRQHPFASFQIDHFQNRVWRRQSNAALSRRLSNN